MGANPRGMGVYIPPPIIQQHPPNIFRGSEKFPILCIDQFWMANLHPPNIEKWTILLNHSPNIEKWSILLNHPPSMLNIDLHPCLQMYIECFSMGLSSWTTLIILLLFDFGCCVAARLESTMGTCSLETILLLPCMSVRFCYFVSKWYCVLSCSILRNFEIMWNAD